MKDSDYQECINALHWGIYELGKAGRPGAREQMARMEATISRLRHERDKQSAKRAGDPPHIAKVAP